MILESPSLSGLRSQTHFSDFTIKFFLSCHQSGHFRNLIIQFYVWFLADQWGSVLGYSSITVLCICWPVPSLVAAAAVLLHIWNLPNEMTRKQSCCSGVGPDLAHQGSCVSSPPVSQVWFLRFHQQVFFSRFSSTWPFLKFDYYKVSSSTNDFSPTRGSVLGYSSSLSHIPLRLVSEQTGMIYFSSTSY